MSIYPSSHYGTQVGFVQAYGPRLDHPSQHSGSVAGYPMTIFGDPRHRQILGNVTIHTSTLNLTVQNPSNPYLHNTIVDHQSGAQQYLVVPPGYSVTLTPHSSRSTQIAIESPAMGPHLSPAHSAQIENPRKKSAFRRPPTLVGSVALMQSCTKEGFDWRSLCLPFRNVQQGSVSRAVFVTKVLPIDTDI